jgi:hypothetical protein
MRLASSSGVSAAFTPSFELLAPPRLQDVESHDTKMHRALAQLHRAHLAPDVPDAPFTAVEQRAHELLAFEQRMLEEARARVRHRAAEAPTDPDHFAAWFLSLEHNGPGQGDPLFPYLEELATLDEMRWFLTQEVAGEAGFDDLVALTQVKMPARAKLEMARNYWDEMGRGNEKAMHGPLLAHLAHDLALPRDVEPVVESVALGNLMIAMASSRRHAFHSAGALGVIELTAPGRAAMVNRGLERLGVPGHVRRYYAVHATLDPLHARAWLHEIIWPLVAERPTLARAFAEGALIRLDAGARCFARYRRDLSRSVPS